MKLRWLAAVAGLWLALAMAVAAAPAPVARTAVRVYDTGDGLPQNSVISMVQTRDGYLWLGTLNGLSRFDGQRFTTFDESNTPGLNDSRILNLFEDSQARLWIGTETAGTALMKDGRLLALGRGELSGGGAERRLVSICESADGAVWLYTANGDLWRYQRQQLTRFFLPAALAATPRSIIQETNGPLWVATSRGQYALGSIPENGAGELPVTKQMPAGRLNRAASRKQIPISSLAEASTRMSCSPKPNSHGDSQCALHPVAAEPRSVQKANSYQ